MESDARAQSFRRERILSVNRNDNLEIDRPRARDRELARLIPGDVHLVVLALQLTKVANPGRLSKVCAPNCKCSTVSNPERNPEASDALGALDITVIRDVATRTKTEEIMIPTNLRRSSIHFRLKLS